MRADRLLSLLMLLEVHRKLTAQELARRLEVSERTIHRDMEALSASGVPVYAERGTGGGWALQDDYHVKLNGLNQAEIRSLFLNSPAALLADLGLEESSEAAYRKLSAALSPASRQDAAYARQRIHVDGAGWQSRTEEVPYLPLVQSAVWEERQLAFTYATYAAETDDSESPALPERVVHPLGLVAKGRTWYMAAATREGAIRTYRVSRIRSAALLDEPVVRPDGFDLAAFWEQAKQELKVKLPHYVTKLLMDPRTLRKLKSASYVKVISVGAPLAERSGRPGWLPAEADFETLDNAVEVILSLGASLLVLEPEELRSEVARQAAALAELYANAAADDYSPGGD